MLNEIIAWGLVAYLLALAFVQVRIAVRRSNGAITTRLPMIVLVSLIGWCVYVFALDKLGLIRTFELPPRLPLFVILPAFVLIGIVLTRSITSKILERTAVHFLIAFQWFRIIVEFVIYRAYLQGVLPEAVTFDGGNFDIWVGISALPVALLARNGRLTPQVLIGWNILGILVLANTVRVFLSTAFFSDAPELGLEFTEVPYVYIAALFMPLAMLVHGLSIKQLVKLKR